MLEDSYVSLALVTGRIKPTPARGCSQSLRTDNITIVVYCARHTSISTDARDRIQERLLIRARFLTSRLAFDAGENWQHLADIILCNCAQSVTKHVAAARTWDAVRDVIDIPARIPINRSPYFIAPKPMIQAR